METTATVSDETKAAPEFVVLVEDVKVKEGKPAKFVAKATGEPVPKITWYHDNEPITEGDIYKIRYSHKSNIIDTKYIYWKFKVKFTKDCMLSRTAEHSW